MNTLRFIICFLFIQFSAISFSQGYYFNAYPYNSTIPSQANLGTVLLSTDFTCSNPDNFTVYNGYAIKKYIDSMAGTSNSYSRSGLILGKTKKFTDTFSVSSASPVLDISSASFNKIFSVQVVGINNTSTVANMPSVSVKSYNTTSVTLNVLQSNTTTVSLLGAIVAGLQSASNFTGVKVFVEVIGN